MKNVNKLTVGELKKAISDLPDDLEIGLNTMCHDVHSYGTKTVRYNGIKRDFFILNDEPED